MPLCCRVYVPEQNDQLCVMPGGKITRGFEHYGAIAFFSSSGSPTNAQLRDKINEIISALQWVGIIDSSGAGNNNTHDPRYDDLVANWIANCGGDSNSVGTCPESGLYWTTGGDIIHSGDRPATSGDGGDASSGGSRTTSSGTPDFSPGPPVTP